MTGSPDQAKVARGADSAGPDWRTLHLWQIQPLRDVLAILGIVGILYLGSLVRVVTVPMLLALALAYLFEPLIRRVTRVPWISRQGAAAAIIIVGVLAIVGPATIGAGFAIVQGAAYAGEIASEIKQVRRSVEQPEDAALREAVPPGAWRWFRDKWAERNVRQGAPAPTTGEKPSRPPETSEGVARLMDLGAQWVEANAGAIAAAVGKRAIGGGAEAVGVAFGVIRSVGYLVVTGFLTAIFFFFFSTGWGRVQEFWAGLIPDRRRGRVVYLLQRMDRVIAGFIRGRLTICAILMVLYTLGYWLIGVPAPLILGPLVGLMALVPFLSALGIPLAMLLLWLEPSGAVWQTAWSWIVFAPIGMYAIAQATDDYFLSPMIQGRNTDMDMPSILFASLAGGALAGVYGLLIAIPVAACVKILLKEVFWPRFQAWGQGRAADFLPISHE